MYILITNTDFNGLSTLNNTFPELYTVLMINKVGGKPKNCRSGLVSLTMANKSPNIWSFDAHL